jgi:molybdopterin converting factor small subunit
MKAKEQYAPNKVGRKVGRLCHGSLSHWELHVNLVNVIVKFMGIPRQCTGMGRAEFSSSQCKLKDVLEELVRFYKVADIMLTKKGEVRPYARVLVNGRSFQFIGGMEAELHEGDTIALIYPWLGHEDF